MLVEILAGHRPQVGLIAEDLVVIRVDAERGVRDGLAQAEERLVLAPLALGDDDRALGGHLPGREQAVRHAVGFEAQGQVNFVGGHGLEVRCPIHVGEGVPKTAVARDGLVERLGGKFGRAFELHMFRPMRDTGPAGRLIL